MRKESTFLASADIARRAGVITTNYRTKDGRYIVSEKALRALSASFRPEEYVNGIDVEIITEAEAKRLIAEGGYQIGIPKEEIPSEEIAAEETTVEEVAAEDQPADDTVGDSTETGIENDEEE